MREIQLRIAWHASAALSAACLLRLLVSLSLWTHRGFRG